MPRGLLRMKYCRFWSTRMRAPSTRMMSRSGFTRTPWRLITSPLTSTRPWSMRISEWRREATPARARTFWRRSPELFLSVLQSSPSKTQSAPRDSATERAEALPPRGCWWRAGLALEMTISSARVRALSRADAPCASGVPSRRAGLFTFAPSELVVLEAAAILPRLSTLRRLHRRPAEVARGPAGVQASRCPAARGTAQWSRSGAPRPSLPRRAARARGRAARACA